MFNSFKNFFNDLYFESAGYDVNAMKEERKNKIAEEKKDVILLSKKSKHIIRGLGIIYLGVSMLCISSSLNDKNFLEVFGYILLLVMDIAGIICVSIKNKKTEIISLFLVGTFIILNFLFPIIQNSFK